MVVVSVSCFFLNRFGHFFYRSSRLVTSFSFYCPGTVSFFFDFSFLLFLFIKSVLIAFVIRPIFKSLLFLFLLFSLYNLCFIRLFSWKSSKLRNVLLNAHSLLAFRSCFFFFFLFASLWKRLLFYSLILLIKSYVFSYYTFVHDLTSLSTFVSVLLKWTLY